MYATKGQKYSYALQFRNVELQGICRKGYYQT